jgi:hypothetical protein
VHREDVVVSAPERLRLESARIGALPLINAFYDRLGLPALLEAALPVTDPRLKLAPATAIRLVVTNLLIGREPIYGLCEWAARYSPELLGLSEADLAVLNDDRIARALDALFDADRASLLTAVVLAAVRGFNIDTSRLHNDSTSIAVSGVYRTARGQQQRGKPTPAIAFGHSKDHRPDLKQLVWILTVADDGAVPITYRLADGNTNDDLTHVPTWTELVSLLGTPGFLYVADSKLCTGTAMRHIHSRGGRFITVLPRSRSEDRYFRDWLQAHPPDWTQACRVPGPRLDDPDDVYSTCPAPLPSAEGFRIVWVHFTGKARTDAASRNHRLEKSAAALDASAAKLAAPRCRLSSRGAIEAAVLEILGDNTGTARWVTYSIKPTITVEHKPIGPGRPGPNTRYRQIEHHRYQLTHGIDLAQVAYDAASDGCFPLSTNAPRRELPDADVLANYRYQPNLERRHHILKSVQDAAPILLKSPARVEALFCCQFLTLLVSALIEREVRAGMRAAKTSKIALYPELRGCTAPSTERILEIFADTARHHLYDDDRLIATFAPDLSPLQQQVLQLADVPTSSYTPTPAPQGN